MLELLQRHPAAIALTVILSLVTLAAGVSGTWYFINQLSAVSVSNAERLAEIRREQEAIRKELATQSQMLRAINQEQGSFDNLHSETPLACQPLSYLFARPALTSPSCPACSITRRLKGRFPIMRRLYQSDWFCLVPWALTALLLLGGLGFADHPCEDDWQGPFITQRLSGLDHSRRRPLRTDYRRSDYYYPPWVELQIVKRDGLVSRLDSTRFDSIRDSDIEHVVSLSEAHDSGLCGRSRLEKRRFARDLDNLALASVSLNRYKKKGKDAGEWLPPLHTARCYLAETTVKIKRRYNLSVDVREYVVLDSLLRACQ